MECQARTLPGSPSASPEQVIHAVSEPMKKALERISAAERKLKYLSWTEFRKLGD